jgi:pilus assembly protein Flp/PilA
MHALAVGVKRFLTDEEGASAIEYALLAGLIAVVFIAGATLLGQQIQALFNAIGVCLQGGNCAGIGPGGAGA